jgi:hypothetical protein
LLVISGFASGTALLGCAEETLRQLAASRHYGNVLKVSPAPADDGRTVDITPDLIRAADAHRRCWRSLDYGSIEIASTALQAALAVSAQWNVTRYSR